MFFSDRTPEDLSPNAISKAISRAQGQGPLLDLTQSNPTQCGFRYPASLFQNLSGVQVSLYEPESFGSLSARKAIARYLGSRGQKVDPENLILTASTSEAYSFIFKLLGNPGNTFLVPTPGYPLFDHLTRLEGVEPLPYPFHLHTDWPVDLCVVEKAIESNTKGLLVVHPNNPTGSFLRQQDQTALLNLCEKHGLAYISDEVFSDYAYGNAPVSVQNDRVLTFRLGGLSKSLGLPQLKLSWMALSGPQKLLTECRERMELIADTYLSVNTPVQAALEGLLAFAPDIQKQILERVLANRTHLETVLSSVPRVKTWPAQAGWYALVEITSDGVDEERLVIDLIEKDGVLTQPGGFYDFPSGRFLVLSLLPQVEIFQEGAERLRKRLLKVLL